MAPLENCCNFCVLPCLWLLVSVDQGNTCTDIPNVNAVHGQPHLPETYSHAVFTQNGCIHKLINSLRNKWNVETALQRQERRRISAEASSGINRGIFSLHRSNFNNNAAPPREVSNKNINTHTNIFWN